MDESIVIVGAGLCAAKAVEHLRNEGFTGPLTLVGAESHRPYDRPGLSKDVLQGESEPESLFLHEAGYYRRHNVETHFGDAAVALDREARAVTLASGTRVDYDRLLIATGSHARTLPLPGADLAGVVTLRTMDDGLALKAEVDAGKRLVLVGGGWIGLEVAASARDAGCEVTVLEAFRLPLLDVLGDRLAEHFAALHRAHGVDLRTEVKVTGFEGAEGHVSGVRLDGDEVVPADLVLVGVGAAPNVDLAEASGLEVDNGIVVDEHLRTADPHVWAAGDVANAHNTALGRRLRVEHWDNAGRQGELAALSLLDRDDVYDWQPYFFTDQYDLSMEYVGHGAKGAEVVVRGDPGAGPFEAFWLEDGVVTAAMNVNSWVNEKLRVIVGHRVDPARLADTGVPLEDLVGG